jgi:transposase
MLVNALRGHPAEFEILVAQGVSRIRELITILTDESPDAPLPLLARRALAPLVNQLLDLQPRIRALEAELLAWHRQSQQSRRLETISGVDFITATALAAAVPDPSHFRCGREFAAWLGQTPRPNSSGGKERLGRISKMGDGYLRTLLVVGATAVIRYARAKAAADTAWINSLLARKSARLASVALANKTARIAWAVLAKGEVYRAPASAA